MNKELLEFKKLLRNCYSIETTHPSCTKDYEKHDMSYGQCAITALLVYDKFKGKLCKTTVNGISHYFNIINDEIIDLTKEQFENDIDYKNYKEKSYEDLLKNENTKERYLKLRELLELSQIDMQISKCNLCQNMVEHFPNSKTVSLGKTHDVVILGEAPANNGWRKSKIAWYDINKKLLPSGVIMQKLLNIINLELSDTYFLEAIKCYPKDRKYLNKCGKNCKNFLIKQLETIKPKVVLSLGDAATKTILKVKYKKFSEIVGKEFYVDGIKIIPIYHPSPISPLSYKGNIPIFEKLKINL